MTSFGMSDIVQGCHATSHSVGNMFKTSSFVRRHLCCLEKWLACLFPHGHKNSSRRKLDFFGSDPDTRNWTCATHQSPLQIKQHDKDKVKAFNRISGTATSSPRVLAAAPLQSTCLIPTLDGAAHEFHSKTFATLLTMASADSFCIWQTDCSCLSLLRMP